MVQDTEQWRKVVAEAFKSCSDNNQEKGHLNEGSYISYHLFVIFMLNSWLLYCHFMKFEVDEDENKPLELLNFAVEVICNIG